MGDWRNGAWVPILAVTAAPASAQTAVPPTQLAGAQALALIQTLNADLLASRSATATLEAWCVAHDLANPARIRAEVQTGATNPITAEQRMRLSIGAAEPVGYRRVRLWCGDRLLSQAENWFVPARLTADMNATLAAGDTPFGTVIRPLGPSRRTLASELLWHPLPEGWERGAVWLRGCAPIPQELLRHRALVSDGSGRPLAEVVETYQRGLFAFAVPWAKAARRAGCR